MSLETILGSYGGIRSPRVYEDQFSHGPEYKTPDAIKSLSRLDGYTDKLLKEMEDWGYFLFKTVFRKLNRLTPLGAASYYLQELYVAMVKSIKH